MKKIFTNTVILAILFFGAFLNINAQQINTISGKCPSPNQLTDGSVRVWGIGDIVHTPCTTRASIFNGNVDFSGATIIGLTGFVTGTGTTNFVPRWTNGASSVIGNTPFSWDGTNYAWNNTALNATWLMNFKPSVAGAGTYSVGNATTALTLDEATTAISNSVANATGVWNVTDATNFSLIFNANTNKITANNTTGNNALDFDSTSGTGYFKVGDYTTTATNYFTLDQTTNGIVNRAESINFNLPSDSIFCTVNRSSDSFLCNNPAVTNTFQVDVGNGNLTATLTDTISLTGAVGIIGNTPTVSLGNVTTGNDLLTQTGGTWLLKAGTNDAVEVSRATGVGSISATLATAFNIGGTELLRFSTAGIALDRTITAAGTTGNQTINKINGSVNIAGAGTGVIITNSLVNTSSTIIAVANTNDGTCAVKNAVPTASTITITMTAACTGETRVAFWVFN